MDKCLLQKTVKSKVYRVFQDLDCEDKEQLCFGVTPCQVCHCCGSVITEDFINSVWGIDCADEEEALKIFIDNYS